MFFGSGACGWTIVLVVLETTISPGLVSLASPQMMSTLFFFIRKPTPPFMRSAMPRERAMMALRSGVILPSSVRP
ncbi:hypothetical protein D3C72_2342860 [compost metagenome]